MVRVENISYSYDSRIDALRDVSFSAGCGEIIAVVGRNGSGKSTLLKAIAGDLSLSSGHVLVSDKDLSSLSRRDIARKIAFVEQDVPSSEMTVEQYVYLGRTPWKGLLSISYSSEDKQVVDEAIRLTGIGSMLKKRLCDMSGGERQLCAIARVMAQQTPVVLLDEPISNLDLVNQVHVLNMIRRFKEDGKVVVCVLHDLNVVSAIADRVVVMKQGRVVSSGLKKQALSSVVLSEAMDTEMSVMSIPDENMTIIVPENLLNICEKV